MFTLLSDASLLKWYEGRRYKITVEKEEDFPMEFIRERDFRDGLMCSWDFGASLSQVSVVSLAAQQPGQRFLYRRPVKDSQLYHSRLQRWRKHGRPYGCRTRRACAESGQGEQRRRAQAGQRKSGVSYS